MIKKANDKKMSEISVAKCGAQGRNLTTDSVIFRHGPTIDFTEQFCKPPSPRATKHQGVTRRLQTKFDTAISPLVAAILQLGWIFSFGF